MSLNKRPKQKQRQYGEASENLLVEMRRNSAGGERVGVSEGTGKSHSVGAGL